MRQLSVPPMSDSSGGFPSRFCCPMINALHLIVKPEVVFQSLTQFVLGAVTPQIHILVLHRLPQPFHEDVVKTPSLAIHAHPNSGIPTCIGPGVARELNPLVRIENDRMTHRQCIRQHLRAEGAFQAVGQLP
jgi:hypothetical protein